MTTAPRHSVTCLVIWVLASSAATSSAQLALRHDQVIPLTIAEGTTQDMGRVFTVPIECNGQQGHFVLGCFGPSRISKSFAGQCGAEVFTDDSLDKYRDADGKWIFAGSARVTIKFGGKERELVLSVMKDEYCQKPEKEGMIGNELIAPFQWEVDPTVPSLTLRPPATLPAGKPLAILSMRITHEGYFINVRVRNVTQEVALMPSSSFLQAGPELQRKWDFNSGKKLDLEVNRFGNVREFQLRGDDAVELRADLRETNLPVALVGDVKHPAPLSMLNSGLGACVLNRFVYCIEPRRQQLRLMRRVADEQGRPLMPAKR